MGVPVTDPITAGDRQSLADITAEGACPLTRTDIQLIPVRYAYADMAAEHDALVPGYPLGFQPIGIRQIRDGYLYLFHAEAPDILHEYQVRAGGAVSKRLWTGDDAARDQRTGTPDTPAIVVPRRGHIDVLFSSTPLTAKKCSLLIRWRSYRQEVMTRVSLAGVCPIRGGARLLTKPDLEQRLSHPVAFTVPMDGQSALAPWYWAQDTLDGDTEPFAHRLATYEQDHAYLVVDDLMGHLSDLLDAWAIVDTNHNAWLEREDARYYSACFIRDLIRLDSDRVGELATAFAEQADDADARAVFARIAQADEDQKTELARRVKAFPEYRHSVRKVAGPSTHDFRPDDRARIQAMRDALKALADELTLAPNAVLDAIETLADHQARLMDGSAFSGEQGIADLVRLDDMTAYLDESETHLAWFEEEKRRIVADLQCLLERFYLHGHLYDRARAQDYLTLLGMDNALLTVLTEWSQANGDFRFLKRFYFGDLGHQHLVTFDLKPHSLPGTAKDLVTALKSLVDAKDGPAAYQEWAERVSNSPYLQFPELPPGAAEQLSHHLAQKNLVARLALFELVEAVDAANLQGRLKQVFERMAPGLRAHILDNQRLYQVDLEIADADSLARHETLVKEIERLAKLREEVLERENRLQQRHSQASTRDRRRYKREYDEQIRAIRAQKQELTHQLRERGFQLLDRSPVEGENHSGALLIAGLTRTAYGRAVQSEMDELKRLRDRGGLTRMMDYGRGMIHGQDTLDLPKRIGGLGLVSFVGTIGAVGAWDAYARWEKDKTFDKFLPFFADASGTVGAAASILTVVGSARLNFYYQTISQADEVLTRLARVNVWGGTIAAWAGFFSALADGIKQLDVITNEGQGAGMKTGAGITFAGDSMLLYGSGRMAVTGTAGIYHILRKTSADITWRSVNRRMLSLAGGLFRGLNVYLWIGTALVCIGNWVQSYFNRTDVQRWCEQSTWGNDAKGWNADQQRHELAKAIYKPTLMVRAEQAALDGRTSYCAFRLELPGLSSLEADNMEWAILRQEGTVWDPDHDYWNQAMTTKRMGAAGVALELTLTDADLDTADGFYLAFRYKAANSPNWLPETDKAYHYRLTLHEQGNLPMVGANETKEWQPITPLDAPDTRLTPLIINYHALVNHPIKS